MADLIARPGKQTNRTPEKLTFLLLSLIFVSLLQVNAMYLKKQWFLVYIYASGQSELYSFQTLVVQSKHSLNEKVWTHMQSSSALLSIPRQKFKQNQKMMDSDFSGLQIYLRPGKVPSETGSRIRLTR